MQGNGVGRGTRLAGRWIGSILVLGIVGWFAVTQLERSASLFRVAATAIMVAASVGALLLKTTGRPRWAWLLPGVACACWMVLMMTGELGWSIENALPLTLPVALAVWAGYSYRRKETE